MLTMLFSLFMLIIFGRLFLFGMKATWTITKFLFTIVFLPLILIFMVLGGLIRIAFPVLAVIGLISLFRCRSV